MSRQNSPFSGLSRRERQIMDLIYELNRATGPEIQSRLPDNPSYSTVRTLLRVLEEKGHLTHIEEGLRYVYLPTVPREAAQQSALQRLLQTFFAGSAKQAVAALLDPASFSLSREELDQLTQLLEQAKQARKEPPVK